MAVTNNLTLIHACETTTDATTSCVMNAGAAGSYLGGAGEFVQGTYGYGFDLDIETLTERFTPSASLNLSGQTIWVWLRHLTPTFLDTWANGGVSMLLSDGTNTSTWYLDGYGKGSEYVRHAVSTSSTPDAVSGTLTLTAVTYIEIAFTGVTKSKLPENVFIDYLQYGADGTGTTVTGGTSGTPETFADVEGDDVTAAAGMISVSNGVYYLNGPIEFGDNGGTGDMYFKDTNQLLSSISHYRTFTTANRGTAESLVSASHNAIDVVGNSTGTTSFVLGSKTGTLGYEGCTVKTGGNRKITLTCTDANVDIFQVYGSNFIDCGDISLPTLSGTNREIRSTSFNGCNQIDPSTCLLDTLVIADTSDANGGLLVDSDGTANMSNIVFISGGTGHGLYLTSTGSKNYDNFTYSGYGATGTTDAAVYNNSGGAATYNVTGGGDTPTYRNGAGASTAVNNNKSVTFDKMKDNSEVRIYKTSDDSIVDGIENATAGTPDNRSFTWTAAAGLDVYYKIINVDYEEIHRKGYIVPSVDTTLDIAQKLDRNYSNPA